MKISVDQYLLDPTASKSQQRELQRVRKRIGDVVLEFCRNHVGRVFVIQQLETYVASKTAVAPGSASRILRKLRSEGLVKYDVVNRAKSAYVIREVSD